MFLDLIYSFIHKYHCMLRSKAVATIFLVKGRQSVEAGAGRFEIGINLSLMVLVPSQTTVSKSIPKAQKVASYRMS